VPSTKKAWITEENIVKKNLMCLCFLTLCTLTLLAQTDRLAVHRTEKPAFHTAGQQTPAGLAKIFSNLGSKTDLYDDANGWVVRGPNAGGTHFIASPFAPKSNATVEQVGAALQYSGSGANQVNISIYSDNGGVPGTLLAGPTTVTNLPNAGTCCALAVANFSPLAVTAGTTYWIVADTPQTGTGSDFVGVWEWRPKPVYLQGYGDETGWSGYDTSPAQAGVEVLGTIP
jgi:hypothetical protein